MGGSTIGTDITASSSIPGAPPAPTSTTICTEALTRFLNGGSPDAEDITRAINYGLEKVKRDIMSIGKTWRPLIKVCTGSTAAGSAQYANPADFQEGYSVGLTIGSEVVPLKKMPFKIYDMYQHPGIPGMPTRWTTIPDSGNGFLGLYPTPDAVYSYRQRYYADLMEIDLTDQLYSTILRRWAGVLEQGVYVWALDYNDDDRYAAEDGKYQNMLISLMSYDLDGIDHEKLSKAVSGGGQ